jgi:hypothetical protein
VLTSTVTCVGKCDRERLIEMNAKIVFCMRALFVSFWTTKTGRSFDPGRVTNGRVARTTSPR